MGQEGDVNFLVQTTHTSMHTHRPKLFGDAPTVSHDESLKLRMFELCLYLCIFLDACCVGCLRMLRLYLGVGICIM